MSSHIYGVLYMLQSFMFVWWSLLVFTGATAALAADPGQRCVEEGLQLVEHRADALQPNGRKATWRGLPWNSTIPAMSAKEPP